MNARMRLKTTIQALSPDTAGLEVAVQSAKQSIDIDGLATNLDAVWQQSKIAGKHGPVRGFGDAAELDLLDRGMNHIYGLVNRQREEWAQRDDWFYYGRQPPVVYQSPMMSAIETEMWAYWIHSEEFRPVMDNSGFCSMNEDQERASGFPRCGMADAIGNSGIGLDVIYSKLMDLGVAPHSWEMMESARRMRAQSAGGDFLLPAELKGIQGKIDTEKEFEIVKKWAETRKPVMFGGQLVSAPRAMGKLRLTGPH